MGCSARFARKCAVPAGCAAVVVATIAGCSSGSKPGPTPTPSSSAPASTSSQPTEKNLSPTGGNSFTPPVKAPPAQTVGPGRHRNS